MNIFSINENVKLHFDGGVFCLIVVKLYKSKIVRLKKRGILGLIKNWSDLKWQKHQ